MTICEGAFAEYLKKFPDMTEYTAAIVPHLKERPLGAVSIFLDANVVLMMAWHEDFLKSILSCGARNRPDSAREYFKTCGRDGERLAASTWDLPSLIKAAQRRVTFKNRGRAITRLFEHLFGFPLWPDEDTQNRVLDLNVLRQLVVHHGGASLGDDYWNQLSDKKVVSTKKYGDLPVIRRIDYHYCTTVFMKDAFLALARQAYHVRDELLKRPEWVYVSGPKTG